jgi:hypothetical protein
MNTTEIWRERERDEKKMERSFLEPLPLYIIGEDIQEAG